MVRSTGSHSPSHMRRSSKYFGIFFILTSLTVNDVDGRLDLKQTGLDCVLLDPTFGNFSKCQLKAVKRGVQEVSIHIVMFQKSVDNATLHLSVKRRGFKHSVAFYEYTVDACQFLLSKKRNPLQQLFYNLLGFAMYSNLNHSCPYDHDLILERYRFDNRYLRNLPLPVGYYTLLLNWFTYNIPRVDIASHYQIYETYT